MREIQNILRHQLLFALLLAIFCPLSFAEDHEWELQYSENGIDVSTKVIEGAPIKAFKATTVVDASLQAVLSVIGDASNYPSWFHLCKAFEFVTQPNAAGEYVSYYVVNAPWPLKDRDVYIRNVISQDPDTLTVTLLATGATAFGPEKKQYTRIPELSAHWTFKPIDAHKTYIEMVGHGYPGGIIPVWVANMVVTDVPKKSFQNLHTVLKEAKYNLAHAGQTKPVFPNIQYPAYQLGSN